MTARYRAVFFDLDGTLLNSAPDLVPAINQTLADFGHAPLPFAMARANINHSSRYCVALGAGLDKNDPQMEPLMARFGEYYLAALHIHGHWFEGVAALLARLDTEHIPWGVVTNKLSKFTQPLCESLGIDGRATVIVSGDTLPHGKPHPDPLLYAAAQSGQNPEHCIYVGDTLNDVKAGRAAGMATAACTWGYLQEGEQPDEWGADYILNHPDELYPILWGKA